MKPAGLATVAAALAAAAVTGTAETAAPGSGPRTGTANRPSNS
jgi:hypothetical protein